MPVAVDVVTRKKLLLVKHIYLHALKLSSAKQNAVARIMAVISFDLAIESTLKAVVSSVDRSKRPSDNGFHPLLDQADQVLSSNGLPSVPDRPNILSIHTTRNDAQHKARYPNDSEVQDCRTYSRDFFIKVFTSTWGLNFDDLRMTELVRDKNVREFLEEAEQARSSGSLEEAVKKATAGLTKALLSVRRAIVGPDARSAGFGVSHGGYPNPDGPRVIERMQETTLHTALGLDLSEYVRFRSIGGKAVFVLDGTGKSTRHYGMKDNITEEDAEFAIAYVTGAVIQIEDTVGELSAPFGKKDWY